MTRAHAYNPSINFEIFIHKVDGDLFLSDDHKIGKSFWSRRCIHYLRANLIFGVSIDCQREIQQRITEEISDQKMDIRMSFYLTRYYLNRWIYH